MYIEVYLFLIFPRCQASLSRAPAFVIPGFMKAGTSYFYELLRSHPLVLPAVQGVAFKETGCYTKYSNSSQKYALRMNCFPFIESHEVSKYCIQRSLDVLIHVCD